MVATRDTSHRRQQISELVRQHGSVQVSSLAQQFGVSLQTVRKDLRYLSERGVMARAYGGGIDSGAVGPAPAAEPHYEAKRTAYLDEKRRIGARAAAMVQPGDTIAIDSGTTSMQLAEALPDIDLTVVTNDFGVLTVLSPKTRINLVMLGGELRRIPAYNSCGLGMIGAERAAVEAQQLAAPGFPAIKVRLGYADLATDLAVVRAVKRAIGDGVHLMSDYNQGLSVPEAEHRVRALADEGLYWIEEPCLAHDDAGHARVRAVSSSPIQIGENWWGPREMAISLAAGASDLGMPDAMKIGGVSGWLQAAALAEADNAPPATVLASLLHDVGHGPFSHALEHTLLDGVHHETVSRLIMRRLNDEFNGQLTEAIAIFEGSHPKRFLHELISSQLDMDRMDYLKRDAMMCGVAYGEIDVDRLRHALVESLNGYGVAVGLHDRVELSLARQDFDASPAIVLEGCVAGIAAPLPHAFPRIVKLCAISASKARHRLFTLRTPARFCLSCHKLTASNNLLRATVTPAKPSGPGLDHPVCWTTRFCGRDERRRSRVGGVFHIRRGAGHFVIEWQGIGAEGAGCAFGG